MLLNVGEGLCPLPPYADLMKLSPWAESLGLSRAGMEPRPYTRHQKSNNKRWLKNGEGDTVAAAEAEDLFFFQNKGAGGD